MQGQRVKVSREHEDDFGNYGASVEFEGQVFRVTRSKGKRVRLAYCGRFGYRWDGTVYREGKVVWSGTVRKEEKALAIFRAYRRGE